MQYYKGDDTEIKMVGVAKPIADILSLEKDAFYAGAFSTGPLGDLIFTNRRAPLANAISQAVFRDSFPDIFDAFIAGGTFESYLTVFKKIFGDDVAVTFTVPGAGHLQIGIVAAGLEESIFFERHIVDNAYVFDDVTDQDGIDIVFDTVKGFTSQYELEQMLFEMVPAGIFTEITLTL